MIKLSLLDIALRYDFFQFIDFSFSPVKKCCGCLIMLTYMLIASTFCIKEEHLKVYGPEHNLLGPNIEESRSGPKHVHWEPK